MSHIDDSKLHTYLDGECSERERQQIEGHLSGCEVCRERLEEARASSRRTSDLLAELELAPVHAPTWQEIEQRAAARQQSGPRKAWARPSLAWAAVMVLAFGVGWLSNSHMSRAPDSLSTAALQEETQTAEGREASDRADAFAEDALRSGEEMLAARKRAEPAPAELSGEVAAGRAEDAEEVAAELQIDDRFAAAPRRDQQAEPMDELKAAEAERGALAQPSALRVAELDEASPRQFVIVSADDAAVWMGAELRTLPELQLVSTEVGPGSAVAGGLSGLPAIKLTYLDAAGHVIVLVQQRTSEVELLGEDSDPTLVIDPTGLNAYRWHDGHGYRLILLGEVSGDSLRALADRVR